MDVRYFLERRLTFITQLYERSSNLFIEIKRKIEAGEPPYVPPYSEDGEPPFIAEWIEAEESLQVLGRACISMLSAAFHLYFRTWERELGRPVDDTLKKTFKKHGWFNGYKQHYLKNFGINFEESECNLNLLEELVLARNRVQHPDSISSHSSYYSDDDLEKVPTPFFIDAREAELAESTEQTERT